MIFYGNLRQVFTILCGMRYVYEGSHFNDYTRLPHESYSFLIMLEGGAHIRLADGSPFEISKGDVIWIPKNAKFSVEWYGNPVIFPMIHFDFSGQFDPFLSKTTEIQRLDGVEIESLLPYFDQIRELDSPNSDVYMFISVFFRVFSMLKPYIKHQTIPEAQQPIQPALNYIQVHYAEPINIKTLANLCFMSPSHFQHQFTQIMSMPPIKYKNIVLIQHVQQVLTVDKSIPIETVANHFNFDSVVYLCRLFKNITGMTPTQYRTSSSLLDKTVK